MPLIVTNTLGSAVQKPWSWLGQSHTEMGGYSPYQADLGRRP